MKKLKDLGFNAVLLSGSAILVAISILGVARGFRFL